MNQDLTEAVVNEAESIEAMGSFEELDPLDVEITAGLDGQVREVTLILTVGGPKIVANATHRTVTGYWGRDEHTTHCRSDVLDRAEMFYAHQFEQSR